MLTPSLRGRPGRRAIVGVLGRTYFHFDDGARILNHTAKVVLAQAEGVARVLTDLQHIVLTGGTLFRPEVSVKFRALDAAEKAGRPGALARSIGILPHDISAALIVDSVIVEQTECDSGIALYLHTMLAGPERDRITGAAADVFIALSGARGTPREVAAAIGNARPVVFLNSLQELADATRRELDTQQYGNALFPAVPLTASDPISAVEIALRAVRMDAFLPDLRGALRHRKEMAQWPLPTSADSGVLRQVESGVKLLLG